MSGGGPGADAAGNVLPADSEWRFRDGARRQRISNKQDYGNSFVRIVNDSGTLSVSDYFTQSNQVTNTGPGDDTDLGSGGAMLLPDVTDANSGVRHLVVGAGKDRNIYLVERDSMGKFNASANNIWQQLTGVLPGGIWATPAYFNGAIYYGDNKGTLKAFTTHPLPNSLRRPAHNRQRSSPSPGTAPAVSANAAANGIVWTHENTDPAVLHAYDAANLAHELYNSNQAANSRDHFGTGNKFITPTIADGKVFVGDYRVRCGVWLAALTRKYNAWRRCPCTTPAHRAQPCTPRARRPLLPHPC